MFRRYEAGAFVDAARNQPSYIFRDCGIYTEVMWGFKPRWVAAVRTEWADGNGENQNDPQAERSEGRQTFEETEKKIKENATKRVGSQGVEITFVGIRRVGVPQKNLDVVLDAMVTEWTSKAETEKAAADSMATNILNTASNKKDAAIKTAEIQAASQVSEAQEKAKKQFESFKKDPELASFLMQLDALERSVKNQTTLILDETMGPFPILRGLKPYLKPGENGSPIKPE